MQISIGISVKGAGVSGPPPALFTTEWTTTANSELIALPYTFAGTYSGTIDWGDGNTDTSSYANSTHTYATAGTYTIIITGDCIGWDMGSTIFGSTYWTSVVNWGQLQLGNLNSGYNFAFCPNLDLSSVQGTLDLTDVINLDGLFYDCTSLTTINNINSWDTSAITTISEMFSGCTSFNQALSFNTSAVTSMSNMFKNCSVFNSALTFSSTSAVTDMSAMFYNCSAFNQSVNFISTLNVLNTSAMFYNCSVFNGAINSLFPSVLKSKVEDISLMFYGCSAFNEAINWNTFAVTNMGNMFENCSIFNAPVTFTTTANVTNMKAMFASCTVFNQSLSFNTSAVTDMRSMFQGAEAFNQNIGTWNIGKVERVDYMFSGAITFDNFNQSIDSWDTSTIISMTGMFFQCTSFNKNIGTWNTGAVTDMSEMFLGALAFDRDIGAWDVANVENFSNFMGDKTPATFSTNFLDAIYNGWSTQAVQPSLDISFGTAKYTAAATAGRLVLTGTKLWTITDGGL